MKNPEDDAIKKFKRDAIESIDMQLQEGLRKIDESEKQRENERVVKFIEDLKKKKETGDLDKYTKKEKLKISREIKMLEEKFSGIENLKNDLEAIVIVDPREEKTVFSEARRVGVPIVAILSSDNDPSGVSYPIPANDSAPSSIEYILADLAKAYQEGAAKAS